MVFPGGGGVSFMEVPFSAVNWCHWRSGFWLSSVLSSFFCHVSPPPTYDIRNKKSSEDASPSIPTFPASIYEWETSASCNLCLGIRDGVSKRTEVPRYTIVFWSDDHSGVDYWRVGERWLLQRPRLYPKVSHSTVRSFDFWSVNNSQMRLGSWGLCCRLAVTFQERTGQPRIIGTDADDQDKHRFPTLTGQRSSTSLGRITLVFQFSQPVTSLVGLTISILGLHFRQ